MCFAKDPQYDIVGQASAGLADLNHDVNAAPVSYTHLTLPTILRV